MATFVFLTSDISQTQQRNNCGRKISDGQ